MQTWCGNGFVLPLSAFHLQARYKLNGVIGALTLEACAQHASAAFLPRMVSARLLFGLVSLSVFVFSCLSLAAHTRPVMAEGGVAGIVFLQNTVHPFEPR